MKLHQFIFFAFAVFASTALGAAPHTEDRLAEEFVQKFTSTMVATISDRKKSFSTRSNSVRALLKKNTASQKIIIFMLGRYARKINRNDFNQYVDLMEDYTMRIFINRMLYSKNAHTTKIKVINSKRRGNREAIVLTRLTVQGVKEPIQVRWHLLRDKNGTYKLFNLGVEGFWLAQEQRSQFSAFIQKNGGDPKVILPYLRKKIEQAKQDTKLRDVNVKRR